MAYIDREVRAVCQAKGWGQQIRRRRKAQCQPVAESTIDDYEWKLIPNESGVFPPAAPVNDHAGTYYVLSFNSSKRKFVLQHDTYHAGVWGPHFQRSTYTEILAFDLSGRSDKDIPDPGWLGNHLLDLVSRFGPNHFWMT